MKKAIKITSIILVFALICNMVPLRVFAKPEGNPLNADPEDKIYNEILNEFDAKCGEDPNAPISYKIKSKYKDDHREITVYNIPYMLSDKSIIKSFANVLDLCAQQRKQAIEKANENGSERGDEYVKLIKPILESSQDVKDFADSMGLPLNQTIDALIYLTSFDEYKYIHDFEQLLDPTKRSDPFSVCLLSLICVAFSTGVVIPSIITMVEAAKAAGKSVGVVAVPIAFLVSIPLIFLACAIGGAVSDFSQTKEIHKIEETKNIYNVLRILSSKMINSECPWRNQNLFITAIDHRNRRGKDHGSWAGFTGLVGLKNAVQVQEGDTYDEMFNECSKTFKSIAFQEGDKYGGMFNRYETFKIMAVLKCVFKNY